MEATAKGISRSVLGYGQTPSEALEMLHARRGGARQEWHSPPGALSITLWGSLTEDALGERFMPPEPQCAWRGAATQPG